MSSGVSGPTVVLCSDSLGAASAEDGAGGAQLSSDHAETRCRGADTCASSGVDLNWLGVLVGHRVREAGIAAELGVSVRTVQRLKQKHNLYTYHRCSDAELDAIVVCCQVQALGSSLAAGLTVWLYAQGEFVRQEGPEAGFRMISGALRAAGLRFGERRVLESLKRLYPQEAEARRMWCYRRCVVYPAATLLRVCSVVLRSHLVVSCAGSQDASITRLTLATAGIWTLH